MSKVSIIKCDGYEPDKIQPAIKRAVDLLGGMQAFIKPGDKVLLKPNMLAAAVPEKRVTTDPAVLIAVGRMVLEAGGNPIIGDSPAVESIRRVGTKSKIKDAAEELGIDLVSLGRSTPVKTDERFLFKSLEIASEIYEVDKVINLPKLKTHSQMLLTLGVKNLFGVIVAQRKAEWHQMAGVDRDNFASMLLDIYQAVSPALTIMDGVWGMDGHGPSNGRKIKLDVILAATDAVAMDIGLCKMLGISLNRFPLYRVARSRGIGQTDPDKIQFVGDTDIDLAEKKFEAPALDSGGFMLPGFDWFSKRYLVSKPVQEQKACTACSKCVEICPVDSVGLNDRKLNFDYDRCIRCYCCQEVCPEGAVRLQKGWLVKALNAFNR